MSKIVEKYEELKQVDSSKLYLTINNNKHFMCTI